MTPGAMTRFLFRCSGGTYSLSCLSPGAHICGKGDSPTPWRVGDPQEFRPVRPRAWQLSGCGKCWSLAAPSPPARSPRAEDSPSLSTAWFSSTAQFFFTYQPWGHFTFSRASVGCPLCGWAEEGGLGGHLHSSSTCWLAHRSPRGQTALAASDAIRIVTSYAFANLH